MHIYMHIAPRGLKIKNFGEVIHSLEDVQAFLDSKGYSDCFCCRFASARQSTFLNISDFDLMMPYYELLYSTTVLQLYLPSETRTCITPQLRTPHYNGQNCWAQQCLA